MLKRLRLIILFLSLLVGIDGKLIKAQQIIIDGNTATIVTKDGDNIVIDGETFSKDGKNLFHSFLEVLPDSIGNKLQASVSFPLIENVRLNAYLAPQKDIQNYGIVLSYSSNSDTVFSLRWNRSIYDFGVDRFNNELETTNNYYTFFFQTKL